MSSHATDRVRYFEGQLLRRQDMSDEQAYHLAMRRRHNLAHHTWGIVRGLEILIEERTVFVLPGIAVDGYGRELVLSHRRALAAGIFQDERSDALDVWLIYDRQPTEPAPPGYATGGDESFYRWREEPRLEVRAAEVSPHDTRRPREVPPQDWGFGPQQSAPDDPDAPWPVYLGRVVSTAEQQGHLIVDPAGRPYAGLVAEEIVTPWREGPRLELGEAQEGRFAVYLPGDWSAAEPEDAADDADADDADELAAADPEPDEVDDEPCFEITEVGEVRVAGRTTVAGDVHLAGGAIDFGVGAARPPERDPAPQPWQVYLQDLVTGERELRVEMAGEGQGLNRVCIGSWSEEAKAFQPILSVADNQTVTVHGDLVVEGLLIRGQKRDEPDVSPEAKGFLMSGFLSGLNVGTVSPSVEDDPAKALLQAVASRLASSPDLLDDFAKILKKEHREMAVALDKKLGRE